MDRNSDLDKFKDQNRELFQNYIGNNLEEDLKKKKEEIEQQMNRARIRQPEQKDEGIKDSCIYQLGNQNKESSEFSISKQSFKRIFSIISSMFGDQDKKYEDKNFFLYVNDQFGKLFGQLLAKKKDKDYVQPRTILDFEYIRKEYGNLNEQFQELIDEDLIHFANFVHGSKEDKTMAGFGMCVNGKLLHQEDWRNLFYNLINIKSASVTDVCQIQYYFYMQNILRILKRYQDKYKQDITQQFEIYFALAFVKKIFSIHEFYGVPLEDAEFKNFKDAILNTQQMYAGDYQPQQQPDYEPYKTIVQINPNQYQEAQIIQKALINSKKQQ
ncbi:hypothetical protein TTHERM_00809130 (macronuclear) [Tetrahymena thermophila SB210]|uniref:Uncharacterized protein n=1 Tax=Tetrahymena thermophila (strain SB210) TaxID=312017 RepID=Q233R0_TETTS|nr:hypothetical protein TTHERM_00809130 [Tetrahymena thermophila SB210]EAR91769.2 hypothetical protein TTHERM_00809130 [Tetrahymena thermophila SB210]|eukprot:XP_001012014.2 hypothetical protein TTHERM_00809130 [Tetrahymena thermophila SB210]